MNIQVSPAIIDEQLHQPNTQAKKPVDNRRPNGQFGEGNIANPNGRPPKGHSITEMFKHMFNQDPNIKQKLGKRILDLAMNGDPAAIRLIWNYMDGMPKARLEHTGPDGKPLYPQPILGSEAPKE